MKTYKQYLAEALIYNKFLDFVEGKHNILLITGYSGSGKSTLGKSLAKTYNATYIELDQFIFNDYYNKYLQKYHNMTKDDWNNYSKEEYKTDFLNYFNYILKWGSSHKTEKFVIEGVHFFAYSELMQYLNIYPTIIVDKSIIISSLYGAYRDMQQDLDTEDGYKFPTYIKNMYYIFMNNFNNIRKNLNSFVFSTKAGK